MAWMPWVNVRSISCTSLIVCTTVSWTGAASTMSVAAARTTAGMMPDVHRAGPARSVGHQHVYDPAMITLSLDTTSTNYAAGQSLGAILFAGGVMGLVWRMTRFWRRVDPPDLSVLGIQLPALRARRRRIVWSVLAIIAAAGFVKAISVYNPEPRAAQAGADKSVAPGDVPRRVIQPPNQVGRHQLLTGEDAAVYAAAQERRNKKRSSGRQWWYYGTDTQELTAVLSINTVERDPELAAEKKYDSFTQEFRNFFAGAKAHDPAFFDAGPLPGRLGCGHDDTPTGEAAICGWTDAYTFGVVSLIDIQDLNEAARITRDLRAGSDRRS
jgi:hypothetical protein